GQRYRTERLYLHEVDGAGDARLQSIGGEAPDRTYSGLSSREFCPVLGLALAERRDHPHAGNDDDRSAAVITHRSFRVTRLSAGKTGFNGCHHETASKSAIPSPRQCPTPTATI